jgi:hypothetical protein
MALTGEKSFTPQKLNEEYEALMYIWDRLSELPDQDTVDIVNRTFNAWQDWYWGNEDYWNLNELPEWENRFVRLQRLIQQAAAQTEIMDEPAEQDPIQPGEELPPEYVYGRLPPVKAAGLSKGLMWVIGGILATIFLSKS